MDFPIKNGDFPWQNVSSPGRVIPNHSTTGVDVHASIFRDNRMAVDVPGPPPGGVEISGEGSTSCQQMPAARPCATTATLCWTRFTNEIWIWTANPRHKLVLRWSYPKLPHLARKWCVFICFWGSFEEKACKSSPKKLHWPLWWYIMSTLD